jgi:hypothetical protein
VICENRAIGESASAGARDRIPGRPNSPRECFEAGDINIGESITFLISSHGLRGRALAATRHAK